MEKDDAKTTAHCASVFTRQDNLNKQINMPGRCCLFTAVILLSIDCKGRVTPNIGEPFGIWKNNVVLNMFV